MNNPEKLPVGKLIDLAGWQVLVLEETGSTNDDCLKFAEYFEEDFVVWAGHQTAGRGRETRKWHDTPGSSLTFSVLLRPAADEIEHLSRFTALAALALCDILEKAFHLKAEIKWPNDVLLNGKKVCGILSEIRWEGAAPAAIVLGVGINLRSAAFEQAGELRFPATSLEAEGFAEVDALSLLEGLLYWLDQRRKALPDEEFIRDWNERLAFKNEFVPIKQYQGKTEMLCPEMINFDGSLSVRDRSGKEIQLQSAEFSGRSSSGSTISSESSS